MDTESHQEDNQSQQFGDAVSDRVLVDVFKPKFGSEKDIVVFTFLVDQRHAAQRLSRFISQGPFDLVDVEASLAPDEEGHFLVFLEMQRNRNMFATMDDILEHVGFMANIDKWRFRPYGHKTFSEWSRDGFVKTVPQSPGEYADHGEKSNNDRPAAVLDNKPKELVESSKLSLQQLIENQINRHSKAYIKSLQEQIHAVIQDNQQLLERVEELKKEQQYLHQQLQFYQKRENISMEREEQIYERIRDMESKIEMLGSPVGRETESLASDLMARPTPFDEGMVADAGSTDVLQDEQIAMPRADMDIFDVNPMDRSADELDPVETTMFELETSLGVSPAESFLSEDDLLDDDHLDAVEELPPIADPDEDKGAVALEVLDIEDEDAQAVPSTEWVPEPDVTSWQETDALADETADGSMSVWEDDDERFTAVLEDDDQDFESVADLPMADGKSAGPEADTPAKPESSVGDAMVQATAGAITELDPPVADDDAATGAFSAEADDSVVQASTEQITELDPPVADGDAAAGALSAGGEDSVAQASTEQITELDTPLEDADTVSDGLSAGSADQPAQTSSEEIMELETPLGDADGESEDMTVESDLPTAAMEAPPFEAMAPSDAYTAEAETEVTTPEDGNVETASELVSVDTADEPLETKRREKDAGVVDSVATMKAFQPADGGETPAVAEKDRQPSKQPDDEKVPVDLPTTAHELAAPPDDREERPPAPKTEETVGQAGLVDDSKTLLETAPDQKESRRATEPPVAGDLSHLEDTIHELESIVVTETDSEKGSEAADDDRTGRDAVKEQVGQYLKLGNEAYQQSRYLKAIDYFNKAVALTPDVPVGHLNLAVLAYRLRDYGEAATHARRAMKLGSQSASRILEKAESKMKTDKPDVRPDSERSPQPHPTALETKETVSDDDDASEVIELGPENELSDQNGDTGAKTAAATMDARGADIHEGGDREPSTGATAQAAPESGPRSEETAERDIANEYFSLGLAASDKKKYSEALEHFKKAVDLTPEIPAGHLNLAVISYKLKDYRQALKFAEQALANGSRSAQKILDKATDKLKATEQKQAIKPEDRDKAPAASTAEAVEATAAVVDAGDSATAHSPEAPPADTGRNMSEDAPVEPTTPPVEDKFSAKEDVAPAKPGDSTAVDAAEQNDGASTGTAGIEEEKTAANEYFALGLAASEKKNYAEAVEYFQKVVELSPESPAGHLNLAVLAYRQKDYQNAHQHARRALTLGSQSARKILEKAAHKLSAETPVAEIAREKKIDVQPPGKEFADRQRRMTDAQPFGSAAAAPDGLLVENEEIIFDTGPMDRIHKSEKPAAGQADDSQRTPKAPPRKQATSSDSELANEYFRLGLEASEQKAFEKAIRYFTKVTEILPTARRSYIKLAVLYYQVKDFKTARELAQKAIELGSTSAEKILEKSEAKLKQRFAANTVDAPPVPKSRKDRPASPGSESPPQGAQAQDGQTDAAPAPAQQKPTVESAAASASPGKSASERSSTEETGKPVEPSVTKNYSVNEYFAMGLAASERKEYHQAIEYFTKVTELLPDASPSFLNLANLYLNLEDYQTAREYAQRALDLGSKSAQRILDDVDALTK